MKTTKYFNSRRQLPDREEILDIWIQKVIRKPIKTERQSDGRVRMWGKIQNRMLRVVILEDGETIHNAFFDRSFKGDK